MSKILPASCNQAGVVSVNGVVVPDAVVMSEGKKASTGILVIDEAMVRYFPSSATDIKDLITSMVGVIDQVTLIVNGLDAVSTSPGSVTASIIQLGVLKTQLNASKEMLK